jgi:pentatricopeptide repeat protein
LNSSTATSSRANTATALSSFLSSGVAASIPSYISTIEDFNFLLQRLAKHGLGALAWRLWDRCGCRFDEAKEYAAFASDVPVHWDALPWTLAPTLRPNQATYNVLIGMQTFRLRPLEAARLLQEMQAARPPIQPNAETAYLLMTMHRALDDHAAVLQVGAWMREQGIRPSLLTFTRQIQAHTRLMTEGDPMLGLLDEMRSQGLTPANHSYNALIAHYAKANRPDDAMLMFHAMLGSSLQPDHVTCTTLMRLFFGLGQTDKATEFFETMRRESLMDAYAYNTLLHGYARAREHGRAFGAWHAMRGDGVPPDVATYSTMIKLYGLRDPGQAWALFEEMKRDQIAPNGHIYSVVLAMCARHGLAQRAMELFEEVKEIVARQGHDAPRHDSGRITQASLAIYYNTLIALFARLGQAEEVVRLLAEMKKDGMVILLAFMSLLYLIYFFIIWIIFGFFFFDLALVFVLDLDLVWV